jgi:hypothetical protein
VHAPATLPTGCTPVSVCQALIPPSTVTGGAPRDVGTAGAGASGRSIVFDIAIDTAGRRAVVAASGGVLRVFDVRSGAAAGVLELSTQAPGAGALPAAAVLTGGTQIPPPLRSSVGGAGLAPFSGATALLVQLRMPPTSSCACGFFPHHLAAICWFHVCAYVAPSVGGCFA